MRPFPIGLEFPGAISHCVPPAVGVNPDSWKLRTTRRGISMG